MARRKRKRTRARNPASPAQPRNTASEQASDTADAEQEQPKTNAAGIPEVADSDDLDAVLTEALQRYEAGFEKDRQNQSDAYEDLRFLADDEAQWDPVAWAERKDTQRPILTHNKTPQFVRQVTGDIRQMRPAIHVVPVDERANDAVASDVFPEMVRYVERRSDAKGAYFNAADQMVGAGIGHCRIFTEYAATTTFNQEIKIGLIVDGLAVVWDPDSIELTRSDANYCFVPVDFERKVAEKKWPDKAIDAPLQQSASGAFQHWPTGDWVRVCEYWRKVPCARELALYPDGRIVDLTDDNHNAEEDYEEPEEEEQASYDAGEEDDIDEEEKSTKDEAHYRPGEGDDRCSNCTMFRPPTGCTATQTPVYPDMLCDHFELRPEVMTLAMMAGIGPTPYPRPELGPGMGPKRADAIAAGASIEKRDSYKVERYVISGQEVLEGPEEWMGFHIPIVPFLGEEIKIGRRIVRRGIIRTMKDPQRLYNYAISADAEAVALQPKAPFKGTRLNFEQFEDQWETANSKNWPYLEYTPDPANGGRPPEREPPPVSSSGIKELLAVATGDMSSVSGIYPPQLGQQSNETSGKAIIARQREGDTGTFHYMEAFARAIERVGQIVIDLIPHVYDTERTLRVVGDDGKAIKLDINKQIIDPNGDGIATTMFNDVTIGTYQLSVEMGPSYSTKREEAREGMQVLMQSLGQQVAPLLADLYVQGQDFPLAKQIAGRLRHLLPPQIAQAEALQSGEQPPPQQPPQPPPPEVMLKNKEIEGKLALQTQQQALDQKKLEVELVKVNAELEKARIAQTTAIATAEADVREAAMQRRHDTMSTLMQHGHEAGMAAMNGNGAAAPTAAPTGQEDAQQQQLDALTNAVDELQQAVMHIAQMLGGGGPPPGETRPPPAPGPEPPPPGPLPLTPFIGEPQPPEGTPPPPQGTLPL